MCLGALREIQNLATRTLGWTLTFGVTSLPCTLQTLLNHRLGERHNVDMGNVSVPHFGVHLDEQDFIQLKVRLEENGIEYIDPPYIRFEGTELQQETLLLQIRMAIVWKSRP